jgi:16S rRNA (cytidine1402-2'-O)-methyltransferase
MSILYVIGTPIGNLEDITLRALRVLREVDAVVCEDTRVAGKLLHHFEIKKPLISYTSHATGAKADHIIALLAEGKNVALVSDAGTPGISDPGCLIVSQVHAHFEKDAVQVVAIPGPSALVAALSISGLPVSDFVFLGFLPHKKGRATLFAEIAESKRTVVFYESPHRIVKALQSLKESLEPSRRVIIAREMTKVFEEIVSGGAGEVLNYFEKNTDKVRGEFVVMVEAK